MRLGSPYSAILSAVIFNALVIPLLVPLALKGVEFRAIGATALLRRNLLIYGLGGMIVPFIGIKLIDSGRLRAAGSMHVARGRYRILLGAAPGVGKTYRMLQEGQQRSRRPRRRHRLSRAARPSGDVGRSPSGSSWCHV